MGRSERPVCRRTKARGVKGVRGTFWPGEALGVVEEGSEIFQWCNCEGMHVYSEMVKRLLHRKIVVEPMNAEHSTGSCCLEVAGAGRVAGWRGGRGRP